MVFLTYKRMCGTLCEFGTELKLNAREPTTQRQNQDITNPLQILGSSSPLNSPHRDHHLEFCAFSPPDRSSLKALLDLSQHLNQSCHTCPSSSFKCALGTLEFSAQTALRSSFLRPDWAPFLVHYPKNGLHHSFACS